MFLQPGSRPVPNYPDYQLVHKLGAGAFGQVWRARGPGGLDVALKFIRLDPHVRALELRSLQVMKSIRHPNLVSLFGAWHEDNWLILAMELCDRSLQDRLAQTLLQAKPGIPIDELLGYMNDAANGLDALNAKHVQHRDVKPANLLLLNSGVKVADFGLAKALEQTVASNSGAGTIAYTAPECFKGSLSKHSDQYSLAVTYYHLRTGKLLFKGDQAQIMYGHLELEPDLSELPAAEQTVLSRALSKASSSRWANCKRFVSELAKMHEQSKDQVRSRRAAQGKLARNNKNAANEVARAHLSFPERVMQVAVEVDNDKPRRRQVGDIVTNSLGMQFAHVPKGTFWMSENGKNAQKQVTIRNDFQIGVYQVTQQQWQAVMGSNPSLFSRTGPGSDKVKDISDAELQQFPVETVSWNDCQEFIKKLNETEKGNGWTYRLPTEAEWEYACRGGATSKEGCSFDFYFVDPHHGKQIRINDLSANQANFLQKFSAGIPPSGACFQRPSKVGSYLPNSLGLFDMHGNLAEWCQDSHRKTLYLYHGIRGGAWYSNGDNCRAASLFRSNSNFRDYGFGFRLARSSALPTIHDEQVKPAAAISKVERSSPGNPMGTVLPAQRESNRDVPSQPNSTADRDPTSLGYEQAPATVSAPKPWSGLISLGLPVVAFLLCFVVATSIYRSGTGEKKSSPERFIEEKKDTNSVAGTGDKKGIPSRVIEQKIDTNSVGMKFAFVPKGTFWMSENGKNAVKQIDIPSDYYIGVYEVTQAEWQMIMGDNPSYFSPSGMGKNKVKDIAAEDLKHFPVESLSRNDVEKFIKKLNEIEKDGWMYRLPTEAEWEYACRGAMQSKVECSFDFYFYDTAVGKPVLTNHLSSVHANFDGNYPAGNATKGPNLGRTTRVGSYQPNVLGIYDMHGNVWEWCQGKWGQGKWASNPVMRGGSCFWRGIYCRAASRCGFNSTYRNVNFGFRLAAVPSVVDR